MDSPQGANHLESKIKNGGKITTVDTMKKVILANLTFLRMMR